jgi:hypothetical protein
VFTYIPSPTKSFDTDELDMVCSAFPCDLTVASNTDLLRRDCPSRLRSASALFALDVHQSPLAIRPGPHEEHHLANMPLDLSRPPERANRARRRPHRHALDLAHCAMRSRSLVGYSGACPSKRTH